MKKKKSLVALLAVAIIGVVGGTFAYFSYTDSFPNIFHAALYQTRAVEQFVSPENWMPGDETAKVFKVQNTGDVDVVVRAKYTESWVDANGDSLDLLTDDGDPIAIIAPNHKAANANTDWIWNAADGYYYYKYRLGAGTAQNPTETTNFIESVTFNPDVEIDVNKNCTGDAIGEGNTTCTYTSTGYGGGTYTLTITVETLQYMTNGNEVVYNQVWTNAPQIS